MIRPTLSFVLAVGLATVPLSGCFIIINDDDDDDCLFEANSDALEAAEFFRNPDTGQCVLRSDGGGGGPIDPCTGDPPSRGAPEPDPAPAWGQCYAACEGLAEQACLAEPGCRTAYITDDPNNDSLPPLGESYYGCWTVSPGGSDFAQPECASLAAYDCSLFDVCAAVHSRPCTLSPELCLEPDVGLFLTCRDERPIAVGCAANGETACVADATCEPIYEGQDCTCDAVSCTCTSWKFTECTEAN